MTLQNTVKKILKRGTCNNVWEVTKLASLETNTAITAEFIKKVSAIIAKV